MLDLFRTKIFARLFLSCVLFFLIPFFILNIITASISSNSYRSDMISLKLEYSKNLRNNIDSQLTEINLISEMLSYHPEVWNFNVKDRSKDYTDYIYSAKKVSEAIMSNSKYRESFHDTSLYFPSQDSVISENSILTLEEYYNQNFNGTMSFDKFKQTLTDKGDRILSSKNSDGEKTVVLLRSLYGTNHNYSVILMSAINIQHMINSHDILNAHDTLNSKQSESYTIITDSENNILFKSHAIPKQIHIDELKTASDGKVIKISNKYFATVQSSKLFPFNYTCIFSYNISENFRITQTLIYIVLLLGVIVLLFISYRFALNTFSPFKALLTVGTQNETLPYKIENYSQIKSLVMDIVSSNQNLNSEIEKQRLSISNNLFKMLLQNSMEIDEESFNIMFENPDKKFPYNNFQVVVISTSDTNKDSLTMLQFSLLASLRSETQEKRIVHFIIPSMVNDIVILFNHAENENTLTELMNKCIMNLNLNSCKTTVGIGRTIHGLSYFSKSYEDAMCALQHSNVSGVADVFYYDSTKSNSLKSIYFTKEDKKNLQKALVDGNTTTVGKILDDIYITVFEKNILTARTLTYICFSLSNLLVEVIDTLEIHNESTDAYINDCQQTFSKHNHNENFKTISKSYIAVSDYIGKVRFKSNTTLKETVLSYIENNFCNPDISLHQVAADTHISYNYLCRFFKEQTSMAFLDYLHDLRIEKSKELLRNTNKSINEIATELGYLSANSYIRKFRQKLNITPGEYRKNLIGN